MGRFGTPDALSIICLTATGGRRVLWRPTMEIPREAATPTVRDVDAPRPRMDGLGGHRPLLGTLCHPSFIPTKWGRWLPLDTEKEFAMAASRKVRKVVCCADRVPSHPRQPRCHSLANGATPRHNPSRPSDLLPWADPYIAQLVRNLQNEIRHERANRRTSDMAPSPMEPTTASPDSHRNRDWPQASRTSSNRRQRWIGRSKKKGFQVPNSRTGLSGQPQKCSAR